MVLFLGGVIAGFVLASLTADAQIPGGVGMHGNITPGHCVEWYDKNTVEDSGAAC